MPRRDPRIAAAAYPAAPALWDATRVALRPDVGTAGDPHPARAPGAACARAREAPWRWAYPIGWSSEGREHRPFPDHSLRPAPATVPLAAHADSDHGPRHPHDCPDASAAPAQSLRDETAHGCRVATAFHLSRSAASAPRGQQPDSRAPADEQRARARPHAVRVPVIEERSRARAACARVRPASRSFLIGVYRNPPPRTLRWRRDLKGHRLGAGVEHQVQPILALRVNQAGQLSGVRVAPIRRLSRRIEPADVRIGIELLAGENRVRPTDGHHRAREPEDLLMLLQMAPVVPGGWVILAVGVVIAPLRAAKFVPSQQHRHTPRDEQRQQKIPDLPLAHGLYCSILRVSFDAVVVAEILLGPVAIAFAVGVIVLATEAHQIVESEAIVTGHEIDTALGALARFRIDVGAAADPARKRTEHGIVATPEAAHVIAVAAIPLRPPPF